MQLSRFSLDLNPAAYSISPSLDRPKQGAEIIPFSGRLTVFGGGKRTRTADILLAKQALYQLSYTPSVGHPGLEPGTSPLSGVRSNHLS